MSAQDQQRARVATQQIFAVGLSIVGASSPIYDAKASSRALINQETMAAIVDTLDESGNSYKPDRFDAYLAARLEALLAQLTTLSTHTTELEATTSAPVEETAPLPASAPSSNAQGHNPGPPPPPPGQLPNPFLDEFALATPPTAATLLAPPVP